MRYLLAILMTLIFVACNDNDMHDDGHMDGEHMEEHHDDHDHDHAEGEEYHEHTDVEIPEIVTTTFEAQYPYAKDVSWEVEEYQYSAEFYEGETEKEVTYNAEGGLLRSETELNPDGLMEEIKTYISANYKQYSIEDADKVVEDESIYYEVEIESDNDKDIEILFDKDGKYLKVVSEQEDDNEEK